MDHCNGLPVTMVDSTPTISTGNLGFFLILKIEVLED